MQEFPLPTRADAAGLFCFSLHQHLHHGGCIFLFCFIGLGFLIFLCFVILFDVLFSKIISSATLRSHSSLSSHHSEVKVYEKRGKKHHQSEFLSRFSSFHLNFFKVYEKREKEHRQSEFLSWFSSFHLNSFWKVYEKRDKEHHQSEFLCWFSRVHLNFFWKMKSVKKNIISQNFLAGFQAFTSIFLESLWKAWKEHHLSEFHCWF